MNHDDDDLEVMPMLAMGLAGAAVLLVTLCAAGVFILPLVLP